MAYNGKEWNEKAAMGMKLIAAMPGVRAEQWQLSPDFTNTRLLIARQFLPASVNNLA